MTLQSATQNLMLKLELAVYLFEREKTNLVINQQEPNVFECVTFVCFCKATKVG